MNREYVCSLQTFAMQDAGIVAHSHRDTSSGLYQVEWWQHGKKIYQTDYHDSPEVAWELAREWEAREQKRRESA